MNLDLLTRLQYNRKMTTTPKNETVHTVTLTDADIYIIKSALERLADYDDGAYEKIADHASNLWGQLPETAVTWHSFNAEDEED